MTSRESLPGEFFLDGIIVHPHRRWAIEDGQHDDADYAQRVPDFEAYKRSKERGPFISLRWVLNPVLGIPLEPFTVWRRPLLMREKASAIVGLQQNGSSYSWGGVLEMMLIEVDLQDKATVTGLHRSGNELKPVQVVSGGQNSTVVLDAGPMLGLLINNPAAVTAIRGLSLVEMANGDGWEPFERVGLPFTPEQMAVSAYYNGQDQGPVAAPTDPSSAAVGRLEQWGPVLGWATLTGLDPWRAPDSTALVEEMQGDLLPALARVMALNPPPSLGGQLTAPVEEKLANLQQVVGAKTKPFNTDANDKATITVRPLQSLCTAVATDTWSSLALGFGTGDAINEDMHNLGVDYMVTAPWKGTLKVAVTPEYVFGNFGVPPVIIEQELERELAAIVLAPRPRNAPPEPSPVTTRVGHEEGAPARDEPYNASIVLQTNRVDALPREPRASAYALARYDKPGTGNYQLREHPLAGGWISISSSAPVAEPGTPQDPNYPPTSVTLRNNGVPRPITGPASVFQYYAAASDLFGQWSDWSTAWSSLDHAKVEAPVVAAVKARAAGTSDPCDLTVDIEFLWDRRERSLDRLEVVIHAYDTPTPPTPIPPPPDSPPIGTPVWDVTIEFDALGMPLANQGCKAINEDGSDVTAPSAADPERRYRLTLSSAQKLAFLGRNEVAIAAYLRAEETIRPGEWSDWSHAREVAVAPNPIPPPPPAPLPAVYPIWASLPNAAGLSYATVAWHPFSPWRYRVYEATEAGLLAACGRPGPVLTDDYGKRMQNLFDLYTVAANLPKLKNAFRKLGTDPVLPPIGTDGQMRYEALLPRGSSLIHCFVVIGITDSNAVSPWPQPDGNGRSGFDAYAIPHLRKPALPQLRARLNGAGDPELEVLMDGAIAPTHIRLYRATNAILARSIGTMTLVGEFAPAAVPDKFWRSTTITDPAAPASWRHLHYRAVAVTEHDLPHAGMAVPSEPSRAYALLKAPADPPTLALVPNLLGTTATASLVRVDTDGMRAGSDVGDFSISATTTPASDPFGSSLNTVPLLDTIADFMAGSEFAGYVGGVLYLKVARTAGEEVALGVDVTDPLGSSTHASVVIPGVVPDPAPTVAVVSHRSGGIVSLRIATNLPLPPMAWTLAVGWRRVFNFPRQPRTTHQFDLSTIPTVANEAAMPNPLFDPGPYAIARVDGTDEVLMWLRAAGMVHLGVQLTNMLGQSDSATVNV